MKILLKIISFFLILTIFCVPVYALSEKDSLNFVTGIEPYSDLNTFFYNLKRGEENESIYSYEDMKKQKVKVRAAFICRVPIQQCVAGYQSIELQAYFQDNKHKENIKFPYYQGSYTIGGAGISDLTSIGKANVIYDDAIIQQTIGENYSFDVIFEYETFIGSLEYSEEVLGYSIPFNRDSYIFYPILKFENMRYFDGLEYYLQISGIRITPITRFIPAESNVKITSFINSSWLVFRDNMIFDYQEYYEGLNYGSHDVFVDILCNGQPFTSQGNIYRQYCMVESAYSVTSSSSKYKIELKRLSYIERELNCLLGYKSGIGKKFGDSNIENGYINKNLPFQVQFMYSVRNYDDIYAGSDIFPSVGGAGYGELDVGSLYLDTKNNAFNFVPNFFIWLGLECPILSDLFRPVVLFITSAINYYKRYINPTIASLGLLGSLIVFVLFVNLIKRLAGIKHD